MYSDKFLDHFRNPRCVGELAAPALTVHVENQACGDILRLSVLWDGDSISKATYKTRGCTASIAAGSALTEWLGGKTVVDLRALTPGAIEEAVGGLTPESKHAAVLCVDAVRRLLSVYTQISAPS